jgi:hypothetical protein
VGLPAAIWAVPRWNRTNLAESRHWLGPFVRFLSLGNRRRFGASGRNRLARLFSYTLRPCDKQPSPSWRGVTRAVAHGRKGGRNFHGFQRGDGCVSRLRPGDGPSARPDDGLFKPLCEAPMARPAAARAAPGLRRLWDRFHSSPGRRCVLFARLQASHVSSAADSQGGGGQADRRPCPAPDRLMPAPGEHDGPLAAESAGEVLGTGAASTSTRRRPRPRCRTPQKGFAS